MTVFTNIAILLAAMVMAAAVSGASLYVAVRRWQVQQNQADSDRSEIELLQNDVAAMRDEIGRLRATVEHLDVVVQILTGQLIAAGITPAISPPPPISPMYVTKLSRGELRRRMVQAFSLEGLDALMFDLGVPAGEVPGQTKSERAIGLIDYMTERGRFSKLLEQLQRERPDTDWLT